MNFNFNKIANSVIKGVSDFFSTFKERRFFKIILVYAGSGFALVYGIKVFAEILGIHFAQSFTSYLAVLVLAGYPIVVLFAWATDPAKTKPGLYSLAKLSIASSVSILLLVITIYIYNKISHHENERVISIIPIHTETQSLAQRELAHAVADKLQEKLQVSDDTSFLFKNVKISSGYADSIYNNKISLHSLSNRFKTSLWIQGIVRNCSNDSLELKIFINGTSRKDTLFEKSYRVPDTDLYGIISNEVSIKALSDIIAWMNKKDKQTENKSAINISVSEDSLCRQGENQFINDNIESEYNLYSFSARRDSTALYYYNRALSVNPNSARALLGLARVHYLAYLFGLNGGYRRIEMGLMALGKAGMINPEYNSGSVVIRGLNFHEIQGDYLVFQAKYNEAEAEYRKAFRYSDDLYFKYVRLFSLNKMQGNWNAAIADLDSLGKMRGGTMRYYVDYHNLLFTNQNWNVLRNKLDSFIVSSITTDKDLIDDHTMIKNSKAFLVEFLTDSTLHRADSFINRYNVEQYVWENQFLSTAKRDYDGALQMIDPFAQDNILSFYHDYCISYALVSGILHLYKNENNEARILISKAIDTLQSKVKKGYDKDSRLHQTLALAFAAAGNKEKTLYEINETRATLRSGDMESLQYASLFISWSFALLARQYNDMEGERTFSGSLKDSCIYELLKMSRYRGIYHGITYFFPYRLDPIWGAVRNYSYFNLLWKENYLKWEY